MRGATASAGTALSKVAGTALSEEAGTALSGEAGTALSGVGAGTAFGDMGWLSVADLSEETR
jgi:hypothetical protein